jgi:DNA repair protein SbcC/Rad50
VQLRRVELTNIRSYATARLELGPGTTLLVGDVGAGKTSLLYAIEMALFGVAEIEAAYLVRHGARRAEVSVRFEDAEHSYEIARAFRRVLRRGREAFEPERISFLEDGRTTSYSATEIRRKVIELLGFPDNPSPQARSDLWRWAIYVPQEQMRAILAAKPEERLETVRKALGVERYRLAADNAEIVARDLRIGAAHYREEAGRLAHWEPELAEATAESDRLARSREELLRTKEARSTAVQETRRRRAEAEERARALEVAHRELEGLERERLREETALAERRRQGLERHRSMERVRQEIATASAEARDLPRRTAEVAEADDGVRRARAALDLHGDELRRLTAARTEASAAERALGECRAELDQRRAEAGATEATISTAIADGPAREPPAPTPATLEEIDVRLTRAREEERSATERAVTARRALTQIDELLGAGVCPTCHQTVDPTAYRRHRSEAEASADQEEAARSDLRRTLERFEEERRARERYERAHERWRVADQRRTELRASRARAEESLRRAEQSESEAAGRLRSAMDMIASLAGLEERHGRLKAALDAAEKALTVSREAAERTRIAVERQRAAEGTLGTLLAEQEREARQVALAEARQRERLERAASLALATGERAEVERAHAEAKASLEEAEEALRAAGEELARTEEKIASERRRIATAEEGRARATSLASAAVDLDAKAAWLTGPFRVHVMAMEQRILARARAIFDREFARYFAALVDDPGLEARTDAAFTPEVAIDGEATPAEALSGGERTSLALAFRLALATVVRTLGNVRLTTLLLDEPTDGFSSEQVVRMGELLEELELPQVLVVSHEPQLSAIADRVVRVRKHAGASLLEGETAGGTPLPSGPPPERPRASLDEKPPGSRAR